MSCVHAYAGISGNVDTARQHTSVLAAAMAPRSLELVFELVRILCGASCTRMIMSTVGVSRLAIVALNAKTVDQKWKRRGGSSHIVIARTTMASTLALIAAPALALAFITSCSRPYGRACARTSSAHSHNAFVNTPACSRRPWLHGRSSSSSYCVARPARA